MYGLTEVGPITVPEWDDDNAIGSIGLVACNTEYKVHVCKVDLVLNNNVEFMMTAEPRLLPRLV